MAGHHPGLLLVDSTLPAELLTRQLAPGWTVRDELTARLHRDVIEAIASLPASVIDAGETSPAAELVGAW